MTSEKTAADAGYGKLGLCSGCHYFPDYLNGRKCTPGDACIRAHSGRQIDRFLRNNPELAQNYLSDIFWERRAIATRYAACLLYTSDAADERSSGDLGGRRFIKKKKKEMKYW